MRRSCDQCHGTDYQRDCERGQCYAEQYEEQRSHEERQRQEETAAWEAEQQRSEDEYWRRRAEDEGQL